jgi:RNA polymerase sigma factor (sigma-70 family)
MNSDSDIKVVWKKFQQGDKGAFATLYNLYIDSLYRYGTKLSGDGDLVKDAIQEVFLDLYMKRKKNKTNPENLKYYLILALKRNLIKKLIRNRKLVDNNLNNELLFEPEYSIEKTIVEQEEDIEIRQKVSDALNQLSPKQKEVVYLRFNEALDYKDIAQILNISIESVRKQVYRALKSVRKTLGTKTFIFWLLFS